MVTVKTGSSENRDAGPSLSCPLLPTSDRALPALRKAPHSLSSTEPAAQSHRQGSRHLFLPPRPERSILISLFNNSVSSYYFNLTMTSVSASAPPPAKQPCCVCGSATMNRCSKCAKFGFDIFFCSQPHQKLVSLNLLLQVT